MIGFYFMEAFRATTDPKRRKARLQALIPEEAAPRFRENAVPRNGMMPPPDSEMIAPPITE
jgi:hypothetical protein